jgi:choline dehydrogenase
VVGLEHLRVVDASVLPGVVRAPTHLTTVMVAERLAAEMRGRSGRPPGLSERLAEAQQR